MAKSKAASGGYNPNALSRKELAQLLNNSRVVAMRKQMGMKASQAKCTTQNTIGKWIESGLPTTPEGKLSIIDVAAWHACERKDHGGGRRGASDAAGGDGKEVVNLKEELIKSQIRANNASADYRLVKTELEEIKKRIHDGELVEHDEVEKGYVERARFIRESIEGISQSAPRLQGKTLVEVRDELKAIAAELLSTLAGDE